MLRTFGATNVKGKKIEKENTWRQGQIVTELIPGARLR